MEWEFLFWGSHKNTLKIRGNSQNNYVFLCHLGKTLEFREYVRIHLNFDLFSLLPVIQRLFFLGTNTLSGGVFRNSYIRYSFSRAPWGNLDNTTHSNSLLPIWSTWSEEWPFIYQNQRSVWAHLTIFSLLRWNNQRKWKKSKYNHLKKVRIHEWTCRCTPVLA